MPNAKIISDLLLNITNDENANLEEIKQALGTFQFQDITEQSLLHILVCDKHNERECLNAIKILLQNEVNPNLEDTIGSNFIQTAIYTGYSELFIINIIQESLHYGLDVNHIDHDGNTIMHSLIKSYYYCDGLTNIYKLLCNNGFDSYKKNCDGETLIDLALSYKQNDKSIKSFIISFMKQTNYKLKNSDKQKLQNVNSLKLKNIEEITQIEKYGIILTKKNYETNPIIGREEELKKLMLILAQDKSCGIVVGNSGVGKTALVDELSYRIKTGKVPKFLKNKTILEINPNHLEAGTKYRGSFQEKLESLVKLCIKYDIILLINEIHTIYGSGSVENNDNDLSSMLKTYIDRFDLKVIGTTTIEEYEKYFSNDALKRRFNKINIDEPSNELLYKIISKVIYDKCIKDLVYFKDDNIKEEIINIIVKYTSKNHRCYNDIVNNPDLAISIVSNAFALAKFNDSQSIKLGYFIEAFEMCDRIYSSSKEKAVYELSKLKNNNKKEKSKIIKIKFN